MQRRKIEANHRWYLVWVAETVFETGSSSFYLSKDTFNTILISMTFISEIKGVATTGVFQ